MSGGAVHDGPRAGLRLLGRRQPEAWIRIGLLVAVGSYLAGAVYGLVVLTDVLWVRVTETGAALVLVAAFALSFRRPLAAAAIGIGTVWAELVLSVALVGTIAPAMYAFPVLVTGTGLLLGGRAAVAIAALSAVAVPAAAWIGGAWGTVAGGAAEGHRVLVAAATMMGTALMVHVALAAHRAALADSERTRLRYQGLFASTPEAVVVTDAGGRVVEANPAAERLLAPAAGTLVGVSLDALLPGLARGSPPAAGSDLPFPAELSTPSGGRRSLEVIARAIPASEREGGRVLHVLRDVTDARTLEERLRHAQRLESVGLLAGGVAHDFNNLLTAVGGNAGLLADHPDPTVRQLASEISEAQRRGVSLTRQLLARLAGEQHRFLVEARGAVPVVADRGHVEQVVLNLVANARDAMPGGGEIRVSVRIASGADAREAGSTIAAERQAVLEVADAGVGMTPETVARIFEPFYTTKPRGQGTGLGLSTVHGIVGQNGGCVSVDSAPGRGSTFRVFLPLGPRSGATEGPPAQAAHAAVPGGRERVLVVEDDPSVRSLVRRVLEGAGYEVAVASSAAEALAVASRDGQTRLVLTDVALPGMNGLELSQRLVAERPQLRVLFMSGYMEPSLTGQSGLDPAHDLLRKPFSSDELLRRVRTALDR